MPGKAVEQDKRKTFLATVNTPTGIFYAFSGFSPDLSGGDAAPYLDNAYKSNFAKDLGGTAGASSGIEFQGHPGIAFELKHPTQGTLKCRAYKFDGVGPQSFVVLLAVGPADKVKNADIDTFFNSLRLKK
jgi:hypothetical protein